MCRAPFLRTPQQQRNDHQTPKCQMTSTGIQVPPSSSRVIFAKDHRPYVHAAHLTSAVSTSPYQHTSFFLSTSAHTKRNGTWPGWSVAASPAASHAKKHKPKRFCQELALIGRSEKLADVVAHTCPFTTAASLEHVLHMQADPD